MPSLNTEAWPVILQTARNGYDELKSKFIIDPTAVAKEAQDWTLNNPLSQDEDVLFPFRLIQKKNPWNQKFKDLELENLIRQDVERTFPDQELFRQKSVQNLLTSVLLIWCKLNPEISYRQGMHELLAVIYLVVEKDSQSRQECSPERYPREYDSKYSADPVMLAVFDRDFLEHDTAILFTRLMRSMKPWYHVSPDFPKNKSRIAVPVRLSIRIIT